MKLTILGCFAATPRTLSNPTAQVLEIKGHIFLIDCGEGTQVALRKHKIRFSRIRHVFISHLHGDHVFGLIGLVSTFQMLGRTTELYIHGPKGVEELIRVQLRLSNSHVNYPLHFRELTTNTPTIVFEDEKITVTTIPLQHRVYCNGYLFKAKPNDRKLIVSKVLNLNIDKAYFRGIKKGKDVKLEDGSIIPNHELTEDPPPPKSYAFCSDTRFDRKKIEQLQEVTVLYHESTFLESHAHLGSFTGHSTAKEAAQIAKEANVEKLILGHYSTRYSDLSTFQSEASSIFENVDLAEDGKVFDFN